MQEPDPDADWFLYTKHYFFRTESNYLTFLTY